MATGFKPDPYIQVPKIKIYDDELKTFREIGVLPLEMAGKLQTKGWRIQDYFEDLSRSNYGNGTMSNAYNTTFDSMKLVCAFFNFLLKENPRDILDFFPLDNKRSNSFDNQPPKHLIENIKSELVSFKDVFVAKQKEAGLDKKKAAVAAHLSLSPLSRFIIDEFGDCSDKLVKFARYWNSKSATKK
jgi:hypothetical protein